MTNFSATEPAGAGVLYLGHDEPETINALNEPELWCSVAALAPLPLSSALGEGFGAALVSELVLAETTPEESASDEERTAHVGQVVAENTDWGTTARKPRCATRHHGA